MTVVLYLLGVIVTGALLFVATIGAEHERGDIAFPICIVAWPVTALILVVLAMNMLISHKIGRDPWTWKKLEDRGHGARNTMQEYVEYARNARHWYERGFDDAQRDDYDPPGTCNFRSDVL